jgi:hypothetical protein
MKLHERAHAHAPVRARTHKYVILIAFRSNTGYVNAPLLRYTYIVCLVLVELFLPILL